MKESSLKNAGNIVADRSDGQVESRLPRIWLLTGYRAGDNAQVIALAEALGWPFEIKHFVYRRYEFLTNRFLGVTLAGIDSGHSDPLTAPWPDLIITAGRRNEPIARWIKAQSGNRTRLIHLGRSWAEPDHFDLIITTPQYQVPAHAKVLQIEAPLHRVTAARLSEAAARWQSNIAHLPRPLIAVLLGGDSPPYVFDGRVAERLGRKVIDLARQRQGSIVVAASPRTSAAAIAALQEVLKQAADIPNQVYRWTPDTAANPYVGYLALADILVVTGDSMSMVAEACATGKPVQIFDMGEGWTRMRAADGSPRELPGEPDALAFSQRLKPKRLIHWMLAHWLPRRIRRDIRDILRPLVAQGRATWLGDKLQPPAALASADLSQAVARARALFTGSDNDA
jgi:mitochondrial fission protein ELM1